MSYQSSPPCGRVHFDGAAPTATENPSDGRSRLEARASRQDAGQQQLKAPKCISGRPREQATGDINLGGRTARDVTSPLARCLPDAALPLPRAQIKLTTAATSFVERLLFAPLCPFEVKLTFMSSI